MKLSRLPLPLPLPLAIAITLLVISTLTFGQDAPAPAPAAAPPNAPSASLTPSSAPPTTPLALPAGPKRDHLIAAYARAAAAQQSFSIALQEWQKVEKETVEESKLPKGSQLVIDLAKDEITAMPPVKAEGKVATGAGKK
jgi:hypothetical protein